MRVKVLLFAQLREKLGKGEVEMNVLSGTAVKDLPERLFPSGGISAEFWPKVRFAVNEDYVPPDRVLKDGDEVAMIPPVAGG